MPSSSSTTPPGPSSSGSTSRHPSPQPYPSPPHRASSSLSAMQRQSLNTVPQLELHRDVSNPFNHTLNYTLSPIPDEGVQRSSYASSSSDRGDDQGSASTRAGPGGAGAGTTEREVHSEDRSAAGRGGSMDRQASNLVASRPPPSPPIPPTAPQPTQRESDSGNSSATAVDPDHTEAVGADDGLPPVIATDYCESPAAVGVVEDAGGLGGVHGSGSSKTRTGGGESGRHSKDSSSSASASTTTPRTPNRHRSASASHSASSNASTGTGTGPRMMSGLSPAIRDKLPSFRKATSSKTRSGSLLPLPATTHREPTNRGSASSARRDRSGNSSGSSTSAMSTSRSATSTARRKRSNLSAHTRQSSAQAYRNSVESETTGSETEVDNTPHSQRDRQGSGTGHSDRPSGQHSQAPKSAFDGISGNELAAGHAAASLVRRMTGGSVERQKRQHSRASLGARMGSRRTTGAGHTSDYQSQARMVRERDRTASDNDILRKQLEEDGLMMDEEGHVVNRDRGWSNPPSRGGSGGVKGDNGEKDGQKQGGGHGDGQDQTEEGEGGDDVPVPPPAPRRTTLGTSVSYTSTIVYTSIFADIKNDSIAMAGEFVGTILFLITSLGAAQAVASMHQEGDGPPDPQSSTIENLIGTFYKAFATGTALYGTASIFYRFTGSIFNPSVSLALALTGVIRPVRFILVSTSQMLGGIVAAYILHGLIPGQTEINLKLAASANIAQGLFIESFATTTLILTVLMLGVEKHLVTPHAPLGFGLTLSASMLFAMPYTGAGINVARAFGPALVQGFQPYHWIYWLGPTIGAFLASAFYVFLRYIQYWEVNPGQDSTQPLAGPPESGRKLRKKAGLKKREVLSPKG